MKLSPFFTVLAGSGQAQPLTFWRESDLFAYQVREQIPKNGLGNRFIKKYDEVRDVMRWFRDESICDTDVTSPSYEPVSFDAVFDGKASPGANIDALTDLIDRWIQSYACIEDQAANEKVQQALFDIRKIAKKNINRDKDVSFHISDDMMTYDQARAYCFSKDMWLANPRNDGEQRGMINAMEFRKWTWFNPSKAADGECWMQQKFKPTDTNPAGLWDGPVGCKNRAHAVCQNGQIFEKSCLSFPIAPMRTTEQSLAQEYCELAGGNLPFFNSKKELAEWQNRPDPQQEWLGIVRNADFESGWATVTGEEATVFAWYDGEPNNYLDHEFCAATDMALKNDPLAWNDVPCDWFEQMFRCRIDSTVYVWEDCPVPVMPDPPACEDPCEGKENCTTFVDSCEIYPEEATVVGTISPTSKHYKISFDFKCTDEIDSFLTVPSANVLRLDSYPDPPPSSITWENRGVTILEVGTLRENPLEYWVYGNAFTREQILNKDLYTKQSCTTEWDSFTLERRDVDRTNSRSTLIRHSDGAILIDYVQPTDDIPEMPPVLYARVSSNIYQPSRLYPVRNYYYEEIPMPEPVKHFLIMGVGNRWGGATTSSLTIATDGSTGTGATIDAPVWNYLADVTHAVVKGELYIFGGWTAETKVAKLVGCEWVEQAVSLPYVMYAMSAALAIENGEKALICFPNDLRYKHCTIFDTVTTPSIKTSATTYSHAGGGLGFYKGNPTTVGSGDASPELGAVKVETLTSTGWSTMADFPMPIAYHNLISLPSGNLLLAGGYSAGNAQSAIWLLKNDSWTIIGSLQHAASRASALKINNSVFIVSGLSSPHAIQRLDLEGDEVIDQEVIGTNTAGEPPVLFEVSANYCLNGL